MDETDPRLVRLVARHFNDLRGYATALAGVVMAAPAAAYLVTRNELAAAFVFVAAIAVVSMLMQRVDRYYHVKFGRVLHRGWPFLLGIAFGVAGALSSHLPFGLRSFWVVLSLYPAWLLIDGWPYRKHMILETGVAVAAALFAGAQPVTTAALAPWFLLFGLAAVVSGLADHALLVRAMRAMRPDHEPLEVRS